MKRVRGVLVALLMLIVVACAGEDTAQDPAAAKKVELGQEFTWNGFTVADGWKLGSEKTTIAMEEAVQPVITGEVTNEDAEPRFAVFEFVFVADGQAQATIHCTSESPEKLDTDESGPLSCPGLGQVMPQGYDSIQVGEVTR